MRRLSCVIGLGAVLVLNSFQSNQKTGTDSTIPARDTTQSIAADRLPQVPDTTEVDTLTVEDTQSASESFQSHKELDFALSETQVEDTSHIRLVNAVCAVSVVPDTSWTNEQQRETGGDWNEVLSDMQYYQYLATDTLQKRGIPTVFASREKRFICFVKADSTHYMIDFS